MRYGLSNFVDKNLSFAAYKMKFDKFVLNDLFVLTILPRNFKIEMLKLAILNFEFA